MPVRPRFPVPLTAVVLACLMFAYLLLIVLARGRFDWYPAASDIMLLSLNLGAALALAYAAWSHRSQGQRLFRAWLILAVAQVCYFAGDALLIAFNTLLGEAPFPSLADGFYLAYYPIFAAGLLLLPSIPLRREEQIKIALDVSMIMLAAGLLLWNFLLAPIAADAGSNLWEILISLAYPVLDLVLFFVLMQWIYRQPNLPGPALLLLGSVIFGIIADIGYIFLSLNTNYSSGDPIDFVYSLSYSLIILAGVMQANHGYTFRTKPETIPIAWGVQRTPFWTMILPYLWAGAAFLLLAFHERFAHLPFYALVLCVGLIFALAFLRQTLAYRENALLYENELRRRRLAEALANAAREMGASLDVQAVPALILEQLYYVVSYERSSVMLEENSSLRIAAQYGFPENGERVGEVQIELKENDPFLQMRQTHQPLIIEDVTQQPNWTILPWLPLNKSWLGVPLVLRDRVIGMISLTRKKAGAFSSEDVLLAKAFAGQAAVVLDNARLVGNLKTAYQALEIMDKTKSSFIEVVAHELRTPLTVIKGYSQVLSGQNALQSDPGLQRVVIGIVSGVDRMHAVVNNMLDVVKIESQILKPYKEPLDLHKLLVEVQASFEKALQERSLTLDLEALAGLPPVIADPDLLQKVFYQVIMNAIKYTPDGGVIRLSGRLDRERRQVEIQVRDNGIGIEADKLEVIFEKFYQTGEVALHSSGNTRFKGGGAGLGLAVARGILAAHGGRIWAASPGRNEQTRPGSTFYIELPL